MNQEYDTVWVKYETTEYMNDDASSLSTPSRSPS